MPSTIEIQREAQPQGGADEVLFRYMKQFQEMTGRNPLVSGESFRGIGR